MRFCIDIGTRPCVIGISSIWWRSWARLGWVGWILLRWQLSAFGIRFSRGLSSLSAFYMSKVAFFIKALTFSDGGRTHFWMKGWTFATQITTVWLGGARLHNFFCNAQGGRRDSRSLSFRVYTGFSYNEHRFSYLSPIHYHYWLDVGCGFMGFSVSEFSVLTIRSFWSWLWSVSSLSFDNTIWLGVIFSIVSVSGAPGLSGGGIMSKFENKFW